MQCNVVVVVVVAYGWKTEPAFCMFLCLAWGKGGGVGWGGLSSFALPHIHDGTLL